jgi:hypothetical protein
LEGVFLQATGEHVNSITFNIPEPAAGAAVTHQPRPIPSWHQLTAIIYEQGSLTGKEEGLPSPVESSPSCQK